MRTAASAPAAQITLFQVRRPQVVEGILVILDTPALLLAGPVAVMVRFAFSEGLLLAAFAMSGSIRESR